MLHPIPNFCLLGTVKTSLVITCQISGYPAQTTDMNVLLMAVAGRAGCSDNPFIPTGRAAVNGVINAEIAHVFG
ncbi:hypothetical protein D3C78_935210 [compost metagenome]